MQRPLTGAVVVITGLPAAGKTALGGRLAAELGMPLLSKDVVKESLFNSLGVRDRDWSLRLGEAAADLLWSLLPHCPVGAIVEIWLDPRRDAGVAQRGLARAGITQAAEIMCKVSGDTAAGRYAARSRHPGHLPADSATLQRIRDSAPLMTPLGIGPALSVNTTEPVDIELVLAWLREHGILAPHPG